MIEDKINPSYYRKKIEVTDFILEYDMGFAEGNIIKYVTRYKDKNGVEDLKKARWYLNKLIEEKNDSWYKIKQTKNA